MKSPEHEISCVTPPRRKCEWCHAPAIHRQDLCTHCLNTFVDNVGIPMEASDFAAERYFAVLRVVAA